MNCKYCQSPMADYGTCPVCGAENPAPENSNEEKKSKAGLIVFLSVVAVTLIAAALLLLGWKCFGWFGAEKSGQQGKNSKPGSDITYDGSGFGESTITEKACYSTTDALSLAALEAPVIRIDDRTVSNGVFNIYYWMEYYNFMNSYGAYASFFGLDSTLPLDQQDSMSPLDENDENSPMMSWEQYFITSAADACKAYVAMELAALEDGYQLPDDMQTALDSLEEGLSEEAESRGYTTVDELIGSMFGKGVTLDDYRTYLTTSYIASGYYNDVLAAQVQPTDAEIEAYFDENVQRYAESGLLKVNNVSVRHILFDVTADVDSDGDGTPDTISEETWAAAKAKADEVYALWQKDPTEENFAALANEHSTDPGSNTNGGLYDQVSPGQMVEPFNDWCFDSTRKHGDTGIVKTDYGYHIMYFVETLETRSWFETASSDLVDERLGALVEKKTAPIIEKGQVNYRNILLSDLVSSNAQ
ncbi:MAG: peptidylprolyl isomerase [Clostridia bacterium]|nr:peptidylprolyl isomerase [Clostridia bacterium]